MLIGSMQMRMPLRATRRWRPVKRKRVEQMVLVPGKGKKTKNRYVCALVTSTTYPHFYRLSLFSISFSNLRFHVNENLIIILTVPNLIFEVLCSFRAWRRVRHKWYPDGPQVWECTQYNACTQLTSNSTAGLQRPLANLVGTALEPLKRDTVYLHDNIIQST